MEKSKYNAFYFQLILLSLALFYIGYLFAKKRNAQIATIWENVTELNFLYWNGMYYS